LAITGNYGDPFHYVIAVTPKRCRQLVREWAKIHQQELIEMWDTQNFHRVEPLE
jgi:NADH:ubiquinone oxidoreductase subunit